MTTNSTSLPDASPARDWLDDLLDSDASEGRSEYIPDEGFTARVMHALPAPMVLLPTWRRPAISALWGVAAIAFAVALPGVVLDVAREAFRLVAANPVSLSGIAGAVAIAGVLMWTAAAYAVRTSE